MLKILSKNLATYKFLKQAHMMYIINKSFQKNVSLQIFNNSHCNNYESKNMQLRYFHSEPDSRWNLWRRYKIRLFIKDRGANYYENIIDQLNYFDIFKEFDLEDTFNSWFLITELHVWMLSLRIMEERKYGIRIRDQIVHSMWLDVHERAKKLGSMDTKVKQTQINLLGKQFNAALLEYDEAFMTSDMAMAGHLWRRFFSKKVDNPLLVEKLLNYMHRRIVYLSSIPQKSIYSIDYNIKWDTDLSFRDPIRKFNYEIKEERKLSQSQRI